jgi:putative spermidine/putrescine transport system substrate-binding protein
MCAGLPDAARRRFSPTANHAEEQGMSKNTTGPIRISRRRVLRSGAALAGLTAGSGALTGFPTIWAQNIKDITLFHAGPPVAAIPQIGEQATKDLGFTIKMQATESMDLLNRFLSQSSAIDVGDVSIVFMKYLVGRNVLQAIPLSKYRDWDKVIPLFSKGVYPNGSEASTQGAAPYTVLYATGSDGQKFATGGVIDVAMALEARGDLKYGNKGNMTREEIDKTINTMMEVKKSGQFRSFWSTFDQSVNLMASGEVVIQSMWSPAVTAVKARGIPCVFQPLQEGYRGWGYTLAPMKHLAGLKLDCFYEYMNWYTSGFQGAFIARQGYYSSVPENAKKFLSEAEWDYWYGGKPAAVDITDPYGKLMEKAGSTRDGGAFWDRMGNIAVWNSVMDEDRYLTRRWNEFITS